ncbi:DUF4367 domain-containing protein [Paenibacillus sp. 843]|uniref:DUF4367 domain-containing protein n=1 Tax=Paenibacillus sp. 843 TaxID=3341795 RepID=UPI0037277D34
MFKLILSFIAIIILYVGSNELVIVSGENSSVMNLEKLQDATDFKLLAPSLDEYKLEIKEPYPFPLKSQVTKVRLHYFDKTGQTYLFGIEEHKAYDYTIKREVTIIDMQNKSSKNRTIVEDFKFDLSGEKIDLNEVEARYVPWANHKPGGYLRWIQDGTYLEMDSGNLSKEKMIELAKSFN